jgi:hypothetical protein
MESAAVDSQISDNPEDITYNSSSAVNTSVAGPDSVKPLGPRELPETFFLHYRLNVDCERYRANIA